ncbi:unnamed protein product, partial [Ectocarpus fasciculatus]
GRCGRGNGSESSHVRHGTTGEGNSPESRRCRRRRGVPGGKEFRRCSWGGGRASCVVSGRKWNQQRVLGQQQRLRAGRPRQRRGVGALQQGSRTTGRALAQEAR